MWLDGVNDPGLLALIKPPRCFLNRDCIVLLCYSMMHTWQSCHVRTPDVVAEVERTKEHLTIPCPDCGVGIIRRQVRGLKPDLKKDVRDPNSRRLYIGYHTARKVSRRRHKFRRKKSRIALKKADIHPVEFE
jgi:predicted RNA-binding Zn-ribbon protein involved in translation (DUF1610 family)